MDRGGRLVLQPCVAACVVQADRSALRQLIRAGSGEHDEPLRSLAQTSSAGHSAVLSPAVRPSRKQARRWPTTRVEVFVQDRRGLASSFRGNTVPRCAWQRAAGWDYGACTAARGRDISREALIAAGDTGLRRVQWSVFLAQRCQMQQKQRRHPDPRRRTTPGLGGSHWLRRAGVPCWVCSLQCGYG